MGPDEARLSEWRWRAAVGKAARAGRLWLVKASKPSTSARRVAVARSHLTWMGVVDDPWAETMLRPPLAAVGRALRRGPLRRLGRNRSFAYLAARTRFYDGVVDQALDAGVRQVVVIAAGYDSRAWRLARPGVRFFEVDHPATQTDKARRSPPDGPTYVGADVGVDPFDDSFAPPGSRSVSPRSSPSRG